jgi:predicted ATPase
LTCTGDIAQGRAHCNQALALYDAAEHRPLATRFGQDLGVSILIWRSEALWLLGFPKAAVADADHAVKDAREIGQVATLMYALYHASTCHIFSGNFAAANALLDELVALADKKDALLWKAFGVINQGWLSALTGKASNAIEMITSGINAFRSTGARLWSPLYLSYLGRADAEIGKFDDAWRYIGEAMTVVETTKERWHEAEINRMAGEITLLAPEPDAAKAETFFDRALAVARQQQAKSWELRAAMSTARLWCDQGKPQQARELLAPVYGWFTEGFDTRDLREAKALLEELAA